MSKPTLIAGHEWKIVVPTKFSKVFVLLSGILSVCGCESTPIASLDLSEEQFSVAYFDTLDAMVGLRICITARIEGTHGDGAVRLQAPSPAFNVAEQPIRMYPPRSVYIKRAQSERRSFLGRNTVCGRLQANNRLCQYGIPDCMHYELLDARLRS